jgi:hypothetical protein
MCSNALNIDGDLNPQSSVQEVETMTTVPRQREVCKRFKAETLLLGINFPRRQENSFKNVPLGAL